MEITDVRVRRLNSEGKMRAIVSVTFNDEFVVHDIRVIEGTNSLFIAMPSKRTPDGQFRDIAHPVTSQAREKIQDAVLKKYKEHAQEKEDKEKDSVENNDSIEDES